MLKMQLSGGDAFSTLRDKLDATLMVDYQGEQLPLAAIRSKAYDPDPQVRKAAYEAELASYAKIEIPMAACLNGIKGEALTMIEAQHFDSVLDQTLFGLPTWTGKPWTPCWTAIREALPAFRKYLRKKGELLGHKNGLPFYDLFAPLAPQGYVPKPTRSRKPGKSCSLKWASSPPTWPHSSTTPLKTAGSTCIPGTARAAARSARSFTSWTRAGC